ncbi:MAG: nucleotide exchange factor GrpE [Candidatus Promineifilaceae bacterium]
MSDEKVNENEFNVEDAVEGEELSTDATDRAADVVDGEFIEAESAEGEVTAGEPSLEDQLQEARDEAAKNLDSYLRAQAELANARKRFEKQRTQTYVNANSDMVARLLPVLDDFERAIDTVPEEIAGDAWYEGIELVYRKLLGILTSLNVQEIEALGQPFDPNFHEALGVEPSEEVESGAVSRVMVKGYRLGDKVIRPSLVYVAA